jgi:hypothetical protein
MPKHREWHIRTYTVRLKMKKIETAMINTLQLAAPKNLIQMSSDVINYNSNCHSGLSLITGI